jgi:hypothetical protein
MEEWTKSIFTLLTYFFVTRFSIEVATSGLLYNRFELSKFLK